MATPSTLTSGQEPPDYLRSLSAAQLAAATHPAQGALSISAPPGSGKTRVLTSRVAWLVRHEKIMPEEMVVVTFTNKAANEMRHRLNALIGTDRTSRLILGTFHATCARFLRKYGSMIGIQNNFSIMDADDSRKVIKGILSGLKDDLEAEGLKIKPEQAQSTISWSKAKGVSPKQYRATVDKPTGKGYRGAHEEISSYKKALATVYDMYEAHLQKANALDFDDLLVKGAELLTQNTAIVGNIRHVLVDEMQDTNTTQYKLMSCFSNATRCVTTVGDPDQAVYGWRAAEVGNLDRLMKEFHCEQAFLEENYRSTSNVLQAALAVIEQDKNRVAKGLFTSHPAGPLPTLKRAENPTSEAAFVASEIKRLIAHSGGLLNYEDFVILLRYNALSREIEQALQTENIPSRMVGGHKFFDRMEIKDILAYLTLAINPTYTPAFVRAVNIPKRGIGEKTIEDFVKTAAADNLTPMQLAEMVVDETAVAKSKSKSKGPTTVKPSVKKGLVQFVAAVRELKAAAERGEPVSRLVKIIMDNIDYKTHLIKEQDHESRFENVKELINFSEIVAKSNASSVDRAFTLSYSDDEMSDSEEGAAIEVVPERQAIPFADQSQKSEDLTKSLVKAKISRGIGSSEAPVELSDSDDDSHSRPRRQSIKGEAKRGPQSAYKGSLDEMPVSNKKTLDRTNERQDTEPDLSRPLGDDRAIALRTFLEACTLSTDTLTSDDSDTKQAKVTISTCHAAKGLEYPVVFVMAVESGIFPFYRCTKEAEIDEERRLLYVAMTRAQAMLYVTHSYERMAAGQFEHRILSKFVSAVVDDEHGGFWSPQHKKAGSNQPASKADFASEGPELSYQQVRDIAKVIEREAPPAELVEKMTAEYQPRLSTFDTRHSQYIFDEGLSEPGAGFGVGFKSILGAGFKSASSLNGRADGARRSFSTPSAMARQGHTHASAVFLQGRTKRPAHDYDESKPRNGFHVAIPSLGAAHSSRKQFKSESGAPVRSLGVGRSPAWIEDYKRTGNTALRDLDTEASTEHGIGRDSLMSSFQSSSQTSINSLKGLMGGESATQNWDNTASSSPSSSAARSSLAPRPPGVGFSSTVKRSKSLGMRRGPVKKSNGGL